MMTETVNVLPHLQELRATWKTQDFRFTKDQQEQYLNYENEGEKLWTDALNQPLKVHLLPALRERRPNQIRARRETSPESNREAHECSALFTYQGAPRQKVGGTTCLSPMHTEKQRQHDC